MTKTDDWIRALRILYDAVLLYERANESVTDAAILKAVGDDVHRATELVTHIEEIDAWAQTSAARRFWLAPSLHGVIQQALRQRQEFEDASSQDFVDEADRILGGDAGGGGDAAGTPVHGRRSAGVGRRRGSRDSTHRRSGLPGPAARHPGRGRWPTCWSCCRGNAGSYAGRWRPAYEDAALSVGEGEREDDPCVGPCDGGP